MTQTFPLLSHEQVALSAEATKMAEGGNGYSNQPGLCAQAMRLVVARVLGKERSWRSGPDALQVAAILKERGQELPPGTFPEVGDLCVWSGPTHGEHGHIAMRVLGNRFANNSTWNWNRTGDARGFRSLTIWTPSTRVFRLWQKDAS